MSTHSNSLMAVSKAQARLSKALQAAVMKSITYHRRIGGLGAGNLRHSKVKSLAMPIAKGLKRSPRMPACIAAVEKLEKTLALCPSNKDPKAWVAAEGSKLHGWLLRATRWERSCLSEQTLYLLLPPLLILHRSCRLCKEAKLDVKARKQVKQRRLNRQRI